MFTNRISWFVIGLCIIASLFVSTVYASDAYVTLAAGAGRYFLSDPSNPAWCQHPYQCDENKNVTVWAIGAGYAFTPRWAGELTYHDLGKYKQSGAWRCSDDGSFCTLAPTHGESEARTQGISLSSVVGITHGFYGRLGVLRYRSKWNTKMWASDSTGLYTATQQYGWSPEIGIGWRAGPWSIELTRYTDIKPHDGAIQGINTFTVGWRF